METLSQIKTNLKSLRLSSMYENIERIIDEAINNKMPYADFLFQLTQDEIDRRKQHRLENAIKKSNLGRFKRIQEFDFDFNVKINRQQIMKLMTCDFMKKNENIIIAGPTGVGKTFIAKAIGFEVICKGYDGLFIRTNKMLEEIYSGKADGTFQKKINHYVKPNLLILDDWGMTPYNDNMLHILNEIISERYENGSLIITSNRSIENWGELFKEPVIGAALLDRIFHQAYRLKFDGKSYRRGGKKDA
jgi:DNA replication protein DnaC